MRVQKEEGSKSPTGDALQCQFMKNNRVIGGVLHITLLCCYAAEIRLLLLPHTSLPYSDGLVVAGFQQHLSKAQQFFMV